MALNSVRFKDTMAQGQGLEVQGQGLVNWSWDKDKDFPRGQEHWVTVKNGLLVDISK